jgi:hypothetical protein
VKFEGEESKHRIILIQTPYQMLVLSMV